MLLTWSNSLWQMGYKESELETGRFQSLYTATAHIQSNVNYRLQALGLLMPLIKEEMFAQKVRLIRTSCEDV